MNEIIISCSKVSKSFSEVNNEVVVLRDVNLVVKAGEQIAIMGPSGSGKTTLLQLLGLLDQQTQGTITIFGNNSKLLSQLELAKIRNQDIGFVYQLHHLLPEFTVIENVMMPLCIGNKDKEFMFEQAHKFLQAVGLEHKVYNFPYTLSGGERQRVALARALVARPRCLFADEPTGNLDKKNALLMVELMQKLNHEYKVALLIVTHDIHLAEKMERIYLLEDGILHQHRD